VDTFGYQTARHYGVEIVKNLMVDAKTMSRWYFVIAMGGRPGTWRSVSGRRQAPC
jgi:6-phosphofructokinase